MISHEYQGPMRFSGRPGDQRNVDLLWLLGGQSRLVGGVKRPDRDDCYLASMVLLSHRFVLDGRREDSSREAVGVSPGLAGARRSHLSPLAHVPRCMEAFDRRGRVAGIGRGNE